MCMNVFECSYVCAKRQRVGGETERDRADKWFYYFS